MIRIMFHYLRHSVVRVFTKKNSGYITYFTLFGSPPLGGIEGGFESHFIYFILFGSPPLGGLRGAFYLSLCIP